MTASPDPSNPIFVTNDSDFNALCQALLSEPVLTLDTEFIRTDTFYPKPGLIQLGSGENIYLVDPLAINDWEGFKALLGSDSVVTVMHSCSEDLNLLQHMLQVVPAQLFDTQRAAAFLGHGYSTSYQALVEALLGIEIPKDETRSNWLQRPLSAEQISYAALDVAHLAQMHDQLTRELSERNMLSWFEADCAQMLEGVNDESDESLWSIAYKSHGSAWKLDAYQLPVLQKLCHWRETTARQRDKPKSWIIKDQEIVALATALGDQLKDEQQISEQTIIDAQAMHVKVASRHATSIARFLNQELAYQEPAHFSLLEKPLGSPDRKKLKACQQLARARAEELSIAPELLARKKQWLELIYNVNRGEQNIWPPSMDNWRRQILEDGVDAILVPASDANGVNGANSPQESSQ
jgi:ribonuclease D